MLECGLEGLDDLLIMSIGGIKVRCKRTEGRVDCYVTTEMKERRFGKALG